MSNTPDYTITSLDTIVVEKDKLLTKLRENRQTHEEIFKAACEGFWIQAKEKLDRRRDQFASALEGAHKQFQDKSATFNGAIDTKNRDLLTNFTNNAAGCWTLDFKANWVPAYPVNYLEHYDRAITMLEFSVADKVSLSVNDFDAYARNNWGWKTSFNTSNLGFVNACSGAMYKVQGESFLQSKVYSYALKGES